MPVLNVRRSKPTGRDFKQAPRTKTQHGINIECYVSNNLRKIHSVGKMDVLGTSLEKHKDGTWPQNVAKQELLTLFQAVGALTGKIHSKVT